jgi:hypothetical protein
MPESRCRPVNKGSCETKSPYGYLTPLKYRTYSNWARVYIAIEHVRLKFNYRQIILNLLSFEWYGQLLTFNYLKEHDFLDMVCVFWVSYLTTLTVSSLYRADQSMWGTWWKENGRANQSTLGYRQTLRIIRSLLGPLCASILLGPCQWLRPNRSLPRVVASSHGQPHFFTSRVYRQTVCWDGLHQTVYCSLSVQWTVSNRVCSLHASCQGHFVHRRLFP